MNTVLKGFFAYPSAPAIAETIRNGVQKINELGFIKIITWEACAVNGKFIISEICRQIDSADLVCVDLTELNANVMFELGYAIARNKKIWIVIDRSYTHTTETFNKLKILTTIGYTDYRNSDDLRAKFITDKASEDLSETIFNQSIKSLLTATDNTETVLYLKSRHTSEASTVISNRASQIANSTACQLIVDDPRETDVQTLAWYSQQLSTACCSIIHLLNPAREGAALHNTKYAFVAGIAHGFAKPTLMLVEAPYSAPIDYRDILHLYQTSSEAERIILAWSTPIISQAKANASKRGSYLAQIKLAQKLTELNIGEPIAENESERLVKDYYIETNYYREALEGRQAIFVGRKGAGKSAMFFKLAATLSNDKRNLVCQIKPLAVEMYGMVDLLKKYLTTNLRTHVIESIWKFLLYSELALAAEAAILNRPSEQIHESERNLIAVLDQNDEMLRQDFSVRLERCITALIHASEDSKKDEIEAQRNSIAQALHSGILKTLRSVLTEALADKQKVSILVDNLDKAWDKQSDIDVLSEFLLGLLSATSRITSDFSNIGMKRQSIKVSLAVFMRADIFYRVVALAREPDKIVYSKLSWNDDEMLLSVLEGRFAAGIGLPPEEVWNKYFCKTIKGIPTRNYFVNHVLKRPRDLLVFVKAAITIATNRKHSLVEEIDILEAEKQYAQFAVDSVVVENNSADFNLEAILYEFVGSNAILAEREVQELLKILVPDSEAVKKLIKLLCNLTFFGVEVKASEFRFADDRAETAKNNILAQKLMIERGGDARYKINPAFWAFLETADST